MNEAKLEDLVTDFLERREVDPGLTPEAFARDRADRGSVVLAIRHTLDVLRLFPVETCQEATPPLEAVPEQIGGHRVVRLLGRGGMGVVYEIERNERRYALKLLPRALLAPGLTDDRFRREVHALTRVQHPSVVRVSEWGLHEGLPFLVMELVEGRALSEIEGPLPPDEAARIVRDLARAVHAVHGAGLLHRDLKPSNVILRGDGRPVLIDFGLNATEDLPSMTREGELLGTPRYMAPEQAAGRPCDARADVYALGLILYELVTGIPPRPSASRDRVLEAARSGDLVRPGRHVHVPRSLERILLHATARRPSRRPTTAALLAADLDRFLNGLTVRAPRLIPGRRLWSRLAQHRVAIVASLLVFGSAAFWMTVRRGPSPDARPLALLRARTEEAVEAWLRGQDDVARELVQAVLDQPGAGSDAFAVAAHLGLDVRGDDPVGRVLERALDRSRSGELGTMFPELEALRERGHRSSLLSVLTGVAAAESGETGVAARELTAVAEVFEKVPSLALELGRARLAERDFARARRALERATELDPTATKAWMALSEACAGEEDLVAGLEAARRAVEGARRTESAPARRLLARLLDRSGEPDRRTEAKRIFEELIAEDPSDAEARFGWAVLLDRDHDIARAAEEYRRATELDPRHWRAALYLANLHSGAHRGQCESCDLAFAAHPELLDEAEAERYLLEALRIDRGRAESFPRVALEITLRLEDRNGVLRFLDGMIGDAPPTPEIQRLVELRRNIEERGRHR